MKFSLFRKDAAVAAGEALYAAAVDQAREPALYQSLGAPDTVEGRFEMVTLHVYFLLRRLKGDASGAKAVAQKLFDAMFADMDASLRELGVGDLVVGKKIRKMAENFYGRVDAYETGLKEGPDSDALAAALARNVLGSERPADAERLAAYAARAAAFVDGQPVSRIAGGVARFPAVEKS